MNSVIARLVTLLALLFAAVNGNAATVDFEDDPLVGTWILKRAGAE